MKIAICDDINSFCNYYKELLSKVEGITVVGTANNGDECIGVVKEHMPDILLLDVQMRTENEGIEIIKDLLEIKPDLKIIMITVHKVENYIFRAFTLGAKDFIYKTASDEEIITTVMNVYNDKVMLNPEVSDVLIKNINKLMNNQKSMLYTLNQLTKLSKSEMSVLRGIYYGKKYKEIAKDRYVEEGTIRAQVSGIVRKMDAANIDSLIKDMKALNVFEFIDLNSE